MHSHVLSRKPFDRRSHVHCVTPESVQLSYDQHIIPIEPIHKATKPIPLKRRN